MKTLGVIAIVLIPLLGGCQRSEEIIGEGSHSHRFSERSALDYSPNHFFVDTSYRSTYEPYYLNEPPRIPNQGIQIVRMDVWIQRLGIYPDPNERFCRAFITLPSRGKGYDPALRVGDDTAGIVNSGPMIKLDQGEYSLMGDGYTGILTIDRPFSDLQMIAIAYRQAGGSQFGEFVENVSPESLSVQNTPLILHLVKAKNSEAFGPLFPVAWNMLVKSIYPLGSTYIGRNGFSLQIVRRVAGMPDRTNILGHSLLNILGLDLYDQNGFPLVEGDGLFDFRPLRTIDPVRGEIIFPYLRPFDSGIKESFTSRGGPQPDSTYMLPEIYDRTVTEARAMLKSTYILQWREF
jgi:hypothetical protein